MPNDARRADDIAPVYPDIAEAPGILVFFDPEKIGFRRLKDTPAGMNIPPIIVCAFNNRYQTLLCVTFAATVLNTMRTFSGFGSQQAMVFRNIFSEYK